MRGTTRRSVRAGDTVAGAVITVGGLAVLAIMLGICVFLVATAAPLFTPARADADAHENRIQDDRSFGSVFVVEGGEQAVAFTDDGRVDAFSLRRGEVWGSVDLAAGEGITRVSVFGGGHGFALLRDDGSIVTGVVSCEARPARDDELPAGSEVNKGELIPAPAETSADSAVAFEHAEHGWRAWEIRVDRDPELSFGAAAPVELLDVARVSERQRVIVTVHRDGSIRRTAVRSVPRLDGRGSRARSSATELAGAFDPGAGMPRWVFQVSNATQILALWEDGRCVRFRAGRTIERAEDIRAAADGTRITAADRAIGANSVLVGDSEGGVASWTVVPGDGGERLKRASAADLGASSVATIGIGTRHRAVVAAFDDGAVAVYDPTSGKRIARWDGAGTRPRGVGASPDLRRAVALHEEGAYRAWDLDPGHPGASLKSLFGRVHYEGYPRAAHVYQSTGAPGTEPKLGLMPLIWGTLKATIVAMLFAVPLAVLAATFTSEYLHPAWRRTVKPTIELMASLPSVVLGFLAAMVAAPLVRDWLPEILVAFGVVPVTVMVGAGVWRMVPRHVSRRVPTWGLVLLIAATMIAGIGLSRVLGSWVAGTLFAREGGVAEIRSWLDGTYGGAWPGWFLLLMLPAMILVPGVWSWAMSRRWDGWTGRLSRLGAGAAELVLLGVKVGIALALAGVGAWALSGFGLDPRDSVFGPFNQRNTLVVGLIMGVAVIPIIYTISEDALRAVPKSLRFASLGCGATPWQTTVRVVVPVAASGIFSACMIGLGRAVGETMIVLMATGNTPEMSMNIFSGFRTLAANIAVELPEAPRESTHYHVLFLCGLVLFVMTLAINSTAEVVRQHFRKRNAAL